MGGSRRQPTTDIRGRILLEPFVELDMVLVDVGISYIFRGWDLGLYKRAPLSPEKFLGKLVRTILTRTKFRANGARKTAVIEMYLNSPTGTDLKAHGGSVETIITAVGYHRARYRPPTVE